MSPFPRLTLRALVEARFPDEPDLVQLTKDFRAVFLGDPQGTRVLAAIVEQSEWLRPRAALGAGGVDVPLLAAFADGRRSMAEWIATVIDAPTDQPKQVANAGPDAY